MSPIKFYFLQASRSIQIAWLLEELGLEYDLEIFDREPSGLAPDGFKQRCGTLQGKAPVLKDGDLTIMESGAICEYVNELKNIKCDHRHSYKYEKADELLVTSVKSTTNPAAYSQSHLLPAPRSVNGSIPRRVPSSFMAWFHCMLGVFLPPLLTNSTMILPTMWLRISTGLKPSLIKERDGS